MLLLVVWNLTEFALQPVKRPLFNEGLILAATLGILVFLPWVRDERYRWPVIGALIGGALHFAFGVLGVLESPMDQGFGKVGPGVAALILGFVVVAASRVLRGERHAVRAEAGRSI